MFKIRVGAGLLVLASRDADVDGRATRRSASREINAMSREPGQALCRYPGGPTSLDAAQGILVFPSIVKAGFLFGAQFGEGAMRRQGKTVGYYKHRAASYGLQAGVQTFGTSCSS